MSDRVACKSCGKWMFHMATKCPHCGAAAAPREGDEGKLSVIEAKALLQATTPPRSESFADIIGDFLLPQGGGLELITSIVAAPLTLFTVLTAGYFLLREKPAHRESRLVGARLYAVPACTALAVVWSAWSRADVWLFVVIGVSFVAWVVRTVARSRARTDFS